MRIDCEAIRPRAVLVIEAGGRIFYGHLRDNPAARALLEKLNLSRTALVLSDCALGKAGDLPWPLPAAPARLAAKPGDLLLDGAGKIVLCRAAAEGEFTPLAEIGRAEELFDALGEGAAPLALHLEWSE